MHIERFLHKLLSPVTHLKRLSTISLVVETAIKSKKMSLTTLGRLLPLPIQERSGIKRVDRLLGNKKLHKERASIYQVCASFLLANDKCPRIIVDWSQIPNTNSYVLRAAVAATGRALTLYEEVYPEALLGNQSIQKTFLKNLYDILPFHVNPIIITDAGFYNDWFKAVAQLGWDYIGRIRGNYSYYNDHTWKKCLDSFKIATINPVCLGLVTLCKSNSFDTHLYLIKEELKKHRKHRNNKNSGSNKDSYQKAAMDPWLLASSLIYPETPEIVINYYRERMQIEEGFRDLKSAQYGLSFEHASSKKIERIQILLMLAMLASLIAYVTGLAAENENLHYQFQANTIKHRRVLSFFFLGCRVIARKIKIPIEALENAMLEVQNYAI